MNIYKHNYKVLSNIDQELWNKYRIKEAERQKLMEEGIFDLPNLDDPYFTSKPFRHYESLFPNNYLDAYDLKINKDPYKSKFIEFEKLLNNQSTKERDILNHISSNESHFIIASLLFSTDYGHHDAYIFPEFQLPPNHVVDYLIAGKNSFGFHFLFVELESPYGQITQKEGQFGATIRKGLDQIEDWSKFLEQNFHILREIFLKQKHNERQLPPEFLNYDSVRVEFAVVAGRREDFKDKTRRKRSDLRNQGIILRHYDNIIDSAKKLIVTGQI